jgi:hypothetical protein
MDLPPALEELFWHEIQRYEEETNMPYLTSFERRAIERGRGEGRIEGLWWAIEATLTERWGAEGAALAGVPQQRVAFLPSATALPDRSSGVTL